jgi:phage tail sheath protein FI
MSVAEYEQAPGVYVIEESTGARPIAAGGTSVAGFVGIAPNPNALINEPTACENWGEFASQFCEGATTTTPLAQAVRAFFDNRGSRCYVVNVGPRGKIAGGEGEQPEGIDCLEDIDEVAIVAAPGESSRPVYDALLAHCEKLQDRVAILDSPAEVPKLEALLEVAETSPAAPAGGAPAAGATGGSKKPAGVRAPESTRGYGAYYYPWYYTANALNRSEEFLTPPSGAVAGIYARSDRERGVHKAPANEMVRCVHRLQRRVTQEQQKALNLKSVNVIRNFSDRGAVLWGARTLAPAASEWRYVNVRRVFAMVEEAIMKGTQWVVFEPNNVGLWMMIKRDISGFLTRLWRSGALVGETEQEAFFVKCDREVNTQDVVEAGVVIAVVGIAVVRPAEFVVFKIGQHRGGTDMTEENG